MLAESADAIDVRLSEGRVISADHLVIGIGAMPVTALAVPPSAGTEMMRPPSFFVSAPGSAT